MRARSIRILMNLMATAVALPACEEPDPDCRATVAAYLDACFLFPYGQPPFGPGFHADDEAAAVAYCEETELAAAPTGCGGAHRQFLACLADPGRCPAEGTEACFREEAALQACLGGQVGFELDCANGLDDDGDARTDCSDPDCDGALRCRGDDIVTLSIPQSDQRQVDLLFVVDDSGSMAEEQARLRDQFKALMQQLRGLPGGLPNLHLGVTSTNLGTGSFPVPSCEEPGGDGGRLLTGTCPEPKGASHLIDVEPTGCSITRVEDGGVAFCPDHACESSHCDAIEPPVGTTTLATDELGCPRCRNYQARSLEDVFGCLAGLGTTGCGFEQPLEAARLALDDHPENVGFLREDAVLGVVWLTDADDCSAATTRLFDSTQTELDSELGPVTSFRCFEFGVTCDLDSRLAVGPRQGCQPREDPGALLVPVSTYVDFFRSLRGSRQLVLAAIAGPIDDHRVTVGRDANDQPEVLPSCGTADGSAVPAIRLHGLVATLSPAEELSLANGSICSDAFGEVLDGLGRRVGERLSYACLPAPLLGCADIGAELGRPADDQTCNDVCTPHCEVVDAHARGTEDELRLSVPPCSEVCPEGPCPGNLDRSRAYQLGHPLIRDAHLPVEACWHIDYQERCPGSNHAELVVARRSDPPARTFAEVSCSTLPRNELDCDDGIDDDQDCLTDQEDPDCH